LKHSLDGLKDTFRFKMTRPLIPKLPSQSSHGIKERRFEVPAGLPKVARQFIAGFIPESIGVPAGRLNVESDCLYFYRPSGTRHPFACSPGDESPGYFRSFLRNEMPRNRRISLNPISEKVRLPLRATQIFSPLGKLSVAIGNGSADGSIAETSPLPIP